MAPLPLSVLLLALSSCAPGEDLDVPDRLDGERAPLTASCDDLDPERCLLPFPSSTFLVLDPDTVTGVRVAIDPASLPTDDDPTWLNRADGFSRLSPVATAFPHPLDTATVATAVRVFVAWEDGAVAAREIPLEIQIAGKDIEQERLILGYPLDVLPANADIVVVVADSLRYADGTAPAPDPTTGLVVGTTAPTTSAEARLAAYHAPTRRLLADAGIDAAHVVRAWDFSTRSTDDPARRIQAMLAVPAEPTVTVTSVTASTGGDIALVVRGTLDGVPDFRIDHYATLALGEDGLPIVTTTRSAPFRIVVPVGSGDYPVVLYGHGTGGDVGDSLFDSELASSGTAKVGIEFLGWNGDDLITMITYMKRFVDGSARSTSALLQTYSDVHQILLALDGALGDTLSADTLGGEPNPATGRRPLTDEPVWVGGSLGGTNGAIMVAAFPEIRYGVLNVPAGGWSHIIPDASLYKLLVEQILRAWYPSTVDARLAIAMSQNAWDDVDGAAWEAPEAVLLLQESMDDPIVPNAGTTLLARSLGATLVGEPLDARVADFPMADAVEGATALTQYRTGETGEYAVHGFAESSAPAGVAAREQISAFLQSIRDGSPRIEAPPSCIANGSCDFADSP